MSKMRLDVALAEAGLVSSRSQAESYIKLGKVKVNGQAQTKAGFLVLPTDRLEIADEVQYVSRAALKLASVADRFSLDFNNKTVLDVGSSTGGFTQFALINGANKVIAVDVGTQQLHPNLRNDSRIELHEKTDIRDLKTIDKIDLVLIDVSFISMRQVLPAIAKMSNPDTQIVAMLKPQFEANKNEVNKGIIKNSKLRRKITKDFEDWSKQYFKVLSKADSEVGGAKGNIERFYLLKVVR